VRVDDDANMCVSTSSASESNQNAVDEESQQLNNAQQRMNQRMQAYAEQQQLANVYGEQPGGYTNPVSAPNYNTQEGLTYMPSMQQGVSDEDMSPQIPADFLRGESKAEKRLTKLNRLLKKSKKEERAMEKKLEEVTDYVHDTVQSVADSVKEANNKETDQIFAPYHDVRGPRGPPGIPGMPGVCMCVFAAVCMFNVVATHTHTHTHQKIGSICLPTLCARIRISILRNLRLLFQDHVLHSMHQRILVAWPESPHARTHLKPQK
jgi:hypothetical protein